MIKRLLLKGWDYKIYLKTFNDFLVRMQNKKVTIGDVVNAFEIHEIAKIYDPKTADTETRIGNYVYQNHRAELEAFKNLQKLCNDAEIDLESEQNKIVPEPVSAAYHEYVNIICIDQVDFTSPNFIFEALEEKFLKK